MVWLDKGEGCFLKSDFASSGLILEHVNVDSRHLIVSRFSGSDVSCCVASRVSVGECFGVFSFIDTREGLLVA